MKPEHSESRRQFIQKSALFGTGILLAGPGTQSLLAQAKQTPDSMKRVASNGYAARDASGKLSPWSFERRPVGDDDVLIEIKFSGICHSDIHQLRGEWAPQKYPQVPGHEIAGVVAAVGKNVTRFKAGDHAGVGCMVDSCGTCDTCNQGEEQHCDNGGTLFTYGFPDKTSPTGITQGGYANNLVVKERFVVPIPTSIRLQDAAPLLCAGITTYLAAHEGIHQKGR
ncbi:MAG TPA: alcohol dehydrogenase catalytic domain-containing protein [Verrucomicrobiae bacterium]